MKTIFQFVLFFNLLITSASASPISAGTYHTCALSKKGVSCWGDNSRGQCNVPQDL